MHQKIKAYVMGVITEESIYVFRFKQVDRRGEYYLEKDPIFKINAPSYKIKEPIGFL